MPIRQESRRYGIPGDEVSDVRVPDAEVSIDNIPESEDRLSRKEENRTDDVSE